MNKSKQIILKNYKVFNKDPIYGVHIEMTDDNLALIESRLLKMEKGIIKKGEKLLKKQKTTLSKIDFINGVTSGNHKEDKLNYLNSIKLFKHIESSNDLPKTTRQLFFSQDIYLINNPLVEKISLTKKKKPSAMPVLKLAVLMIVM